MKRFILTFITIIILVVTAGAKAHATDEGMFFDGPIDMFTGERLSEGEESMPSKVTMDDGSLYDRTNEMFVYTIGDGAVMSSVADGMIVTEEVRFAASEGVRALLYKDGEAFDSIPASVSAPGSYTIVDKDDLSANQVMSFRIINNVTGVIDKYVMPSGFSVRSVYINGEEATSDYGRVDMTKEGSYEISYVCSDNEITYALNVTIDHTPPQVEFEGLDDDNKARGPVTIKGVAEDEQVSVFFNDKEKKVGRNPVLNDSGTYRVVVSDAAGNYIDREFRILIYFDIKAWMFIGFVLMVIVLAAIALTLSRKNLRIR